MSSKYQVMNTYKSLSQWHNFRLRLFAEGILIGIFSGLVICFFRYALHEVEHYRGIFYQYLTTADWTISAAWFCCLVTLAYVLNKLNQIEPLAAGSGIPQVKGAILGLIKMRWLSILWVKLTAGILGIGAGLSLGREGPSIQLGAVAAQGVSRILKRTRMEERYLMTSGASAGLAAAFNAPLAGVIFALEELHRNFSIVVLLPCMAAAMTATVVSRALFGRASIFEFTDLPLIPINYYGIVVIVALVVGLCGVFFNKGLLGIPKFYALPIFKKPVHKITFALLTAGVLGYFLPEVLGGGNGLINQISKTPVSLQLLLLFLVGKLLFTLISYGCGVPGGFFLPMLVIGALCGSICSNVLISLGWIDPAYASNIIVIGMAALFSSSVRAPITGTVLIMEMTASYQHLLALSIAAMVAFVVAELCKSKPIYEELLNRTLNNAPAEPKLMEQRNITELAVCSGSPIENKLVKEVHWPPHTLLVDIKRGEEQFVPSGDTKIMAGDFIYVLSYNENVVQLQKLAAEKEEE